jgi:hypothetical protein
MARNDSPMRPASLKAGMTIETAGRPDMMWLLV